MASVSRAYRFVVLALVLALSGCESNGSGVAAVTPAPATVAGSGSAVSVPPAGAPDPAVIPAPPDADPYELAQRLRPNPSGAPLPRRKPGTPPVRTLGSSDTFTVTNLLSSQRFPVTAVLRAVSPRAYWYADSTLTLDQAAIDRSVETFEQKTYTTDTQYFGDTLNGGYDGDPRLTVLLTHFDGAAGYYSSPDEFSKQVHPDSNERMMLYINATILRPGTTAFNSVVAHELQHALHWHADASEESWINEGMSVLAEDVNGYSPRSASTFRNAVQTQLTTWEDNSGDNGAHYAAAHLFLRFLGEHFGGLSGMKALAAEPKNGVAGIDAYLTRLGVPERYPDVFKHWMVANLGLPMADAADRYEQVQVGVQPDTKLTAAKDLPSETGKQHAARYYELKPTERTASITFAAPTTVHLLPTQPTSGAYFWWSNQGDSVDATLTREVDLSAVKTATLQFKAWYDLEDGWDFGYVQVSPDGGRSWNLLPGNITTDKSPLGNNFGPGFTGKSPNSGWTDARFDLSAYAGKRVLLRFEYVTDEAVHLPGFAIDDVRIPEIGFSDDAERDNGWTAKGFVRTNNLLPQPFAVRVVQVPTSGPATVQDVPLDTGNRGQAQVCCFGEGLERAIVAVAPLAPLTRTPATYQLSVKTSP